MSCLRPAPWTTALALLALHCQPSVPSHPEPEAEGASEEPVPRDADVVSVVQEYLKVVNARSPDEAGELTTPVELLVDLCEGEESANPSFSDSLAIATERDAYRAQAIDGSFELIDAAGPVDIYQLAVNDEWSLPWMRATCSVTRPIVVADALVTLRLSTQPEPTQMRLPLAYIDGRWYLAGDFGTVDNSGSALSAYLPASDDDDDDEQEPSEAQKAQIAAAEQAAREQRELEQARYWARAETRCGDLVKRLNTGLPAEGQMGADDVKACIRMSGSDYLCLASAATIEEAVTCRKTSSEEECTRLYAHEATLATDPEVRARYLPSSPTWAASLRSCQMLRSTAEFRCMMAATELQQLYDCSRPMHQLP